MLRSGLTPFHRGLASMAAAKQVKPPMTQRFKNEVNWRFVEKYKVMRSGIYLYETCVDRVKVDAWFQEMELPDTFLSWFLVTELHVWMCMTRAMADPDTRKALFLRNEIVRNLWSDMETRLKKLAHIPSAMKREGTNDLSEHFNAMLCIYDEGAQKDDKALANALWRVMFTCDPGLQDPQKLEALIHYIRSNLSHLDKLPFEQFSSEEGFNWQPLEDSLKVVKNSQV